MGILQFEAAGERANPALLLTGTAVLLATWFIVSTFRLYFRLGHIPGPPLAGLSKWWLASAARGGRMHLDCYEAIVKYGGKGPFTRIGPEDVITDDPVFMRRMLNVHSPYQKSDWYQAMRFDPTRDNILSIRDDNLHTKYRAKLAPGYTGRDIDHLEPRIDRNVLELVNLLDENYISRDKVFDFGRKAQYFTLDVISDVSFGQAFGFLKADSDLYGYIALMEAQMPNMILTSVFPWLVDLIGSPLFRSLLPSAKDKVGFGRLIGYLTYAPFTSFSLFLSLFFFLPLSLCFFSLFFAFYFVS